MDFQLKWYEPALNVNWLPGCELPGDDTGINAEGFVTGWHAETTWNSSHFTRKKRLRATLPLCLTPGTQTVLSSVARELPFAPAGKVSGEVEQFPADVQQPPD